MGLPALHQGVRLNVPEGQAVESYLNIFPVRRVQAPCNEGKERQEESRPTRQLARVCFALGSPIHCK
jgi:hypothetical protein